MKSVFKIYQIFHETAVWPASPSRRTFESVTYIYDVHRRVGTLLADDLLHQITIYSKKTIYISYFHNFWSRIDINILRPDSESLRYVLFWGEGRRLIMEKIEKMRFFQSYHTLTSIQSRKSLLRLIRPIKVFELFWKLAASIAFFASKNSLCQPPGRDSQRPEGLIFYTQNMISAASFHRHKTLLGTKQL